MATGNILKAKYAFKLDQRYFEGEECAAHSIIVIVDTDRYRPYLPEFVFKEKG